MTATLTLLCGLPGSGKTTHARQMEQRGAFRLSSDDWMVPLYGQHMPRDVFDARIATVRELQWEIAAKLLKAGLNVVLDDGFWRRSERDLYRTRAKAVGAFISMYQSRNSGTDWSSVIRRCPLERLKSTGRRWNCSSRNLKCQEQMSR